MSFFISLSNVPTIFEPMGANSSVFFDASRQQLFTLRSRGTMGVTAKYPETEGTVNFRIDDRGEVLSIKFSPDCRILAIQRTQRSVDFINFSSVGPEDHQEYSQCCKSKNGKLLGFIWLTVMDILFITTDCLEIYQVSPTKKSVRLVKHTSQQIQWFLWHDSSRVLVTSAATVGNNFSFFHFRNHHTIMRICKFEIPAHAETDLSVGQNQCLLFAVYGHLYFVHLSPTETEELEGTNINLYRVRMDSSVKLTDILVVEQAGPIAISVIDNLILVHHQTKKVTYVYDISVKNRHSTVKVVVHKPIIQPAQSIAPMSLASSTVPALSSNLGAVLPVDLYSPNWVINLPNTVIDGHLGCLWTLKLNNAAVAQLIPNRVHTVEFLLNRSGAKDILLDYCHRLSMAACTEAAENDSVNAQDAPDYHFNANGLNVRLDEFASIFKRFGEIFHNSERKVSVTSTNLSSLPDESACSTHTPFTKMSYYDGSFVEPHAPPYTIEQNDVSTQIFQCSQANDNCNVRVFLYALLVEFIRSLMEHDLEVDHSLQELLVSTIARLHDYTQLTYCIQSRFLSDSKPIALQLLSLESFYPAAGQMALDMLKRLNFSNEEVLEILLLKEKPIEALRFCQMRPHFLRQDRSWMERILRTALKSGDKRVFYSAYRFVQLFDLYKKEGSPTFEDPSMEPFTQKFISMFDNASPQSSL